MDLVVAVLLLAAVILAVLHAVGAGGRVHLGWLAIACVVAALGTVPALNAV